MDNEDNLEGWEKTSIKVNIMGRSTIHTEVYAKEFQPGTIILKSGGPVSASPIFIKPAGNTMADESFSIPPQ
ncbi:MAG: hypothetical protein HON65_10500 [Rhodospirillales bacterium]|nr:hypothetical protein [Rhodospirillales bacterium]